MPGKGKNTPRAIWGLEHFSNENIHFHSISLPSFRGKSAVFPLIRRGCALTHPPEHLRNFHCVNALIGGTYKKNSVRVYKKRRFFINLFSFYTKFAAMNFSYRRRFMAWISQQQHVLFNFFSHCPMRDNRSLTIRQKTMKTENNGIGLR